MSWKSFACLAALGAISAPAVAVPSLSIVDNGGSATVNVTTTDAGSLGAEIAIELGVGLTLVDATVNTTNFDTANPGDNPFIAGSPVGGDTTGLFTDVGAGQIYVAYGSGDLGIGTFELLSFNYTGAGDATGTGDVAQAGALNDVGSVVQALADGPDLLADFNNDGVVDGQDFGVFVGEFNQGTVPPAAGLADFNNDGLIDGQDFGVFVGEFNMFNGSAVAVPEPAALAMASVMFLAAIGRRKG